MKLEDLGPSVAVVRSPTPILESSDLCATYGGRQLNWWFYAARGPQSAVYYGEEPVGFCWLYQQTLYDYINRLVGVNRAGVLLVAELREQRAANEAASILERQVG